MKIYSRYLDKEIEFSEATIMSNGDRKVLIPHDALEELIYNSDKAAKDNIQVHYTPVVTEPRHYAFMCAINDKNGRRIESIGEALDATLDTEIAKNYPALMAVKRAFDDAAIKFLGLPGKTYSDQQITSGNSADVQPDPVDKAEQLYGGHRTGKTEAKPTNTRSTRNTVKQAASKTSQKKTEDTKPSPSAHEVPSSPEHEPEFKIEGPDSPHGVANAPEDICMVNYTNTASAASDEKTSNEPDEFDTTIVDAGNVRHMNYSVRECYQKSPRSVHWVANDMLAQSPKRTQLKDVCKHFLKRVAAGLEEPSPEDTEG